MREQNIFVGVEIIIKRGNKIVLGKRKNANGAGDYGLPGGHVEYQEKMIDTAIRELKEETGLVVTPDQLTLVSIADDPGRERPYIHVSFLLEDFEGEPKCMEPEKCEGWEWHDLDNLPEPFYGHVPIINTFKSGKLYLK